MYRAIFGDASPFAVTALMVTGALLLFLPPLLFVASWWFFFSVAFLTPIPFDFVHALVVTELVWIGVYALAAFAIWLKYKITGEF